MKNQIAVGMKFHGAPLVGSNAGLTGVFDEHRGILEGIGARDGEKRHGCGCTGIWKAHVTASSRERPWTFRSNSQRAHRYSMLWKRLQVADWTIWTANFSSAGIARKKQAQMVIDDDRHSTGGGR
ncbi:hypothetical protein J2847_000925 [Azospirillum agricola]|uniref:hypothetical protein n=1 Tax=Azospirillum agricola TaxID=1720247 RepID=UPI001AE66517|nr:hypothetical protein [Azospirillum agricola]MBP2227643.1 hypothetical protein [Azospirillum agricola]